MMRLKPMARLKTKPKVSKGHIVCAIFACLMAVMLAVPPTAASAAEIKYDDCNEKNISDITGVLVDKGIIRKRTIWVSGYTNGRTTIDLEYYNFYGCENRYTTGDKDGGTIDELYLDTRQVGFDGVNADTFTLQFVPQQDMDWWQKPIYYAIRKGGPKGWWMGARGMNRVWGYLGKDGKYYITHICYQTKCTGNENGYGQWPPWHPAHDGVFSKSWWGPYPLIGWNGGTLIGGSSSTCPGHWYYTYDVNMNVNGVNDTSGGAATFDVAQSKKTVASGVTDYYQNNGIRAGTEMGVSNVSPNSGYVYYGKSSYDDTVNADTTVDLPFKTKYSLSYSKGDTDQDMTMPSSKSLIWDDDVTLPTVPTDSGRTVDIEFYTEKGAGSSVPKYIPTIQDVLTATGWSINGNTYSMGQSLTAPKFSGKPNGEVTATLQYQSKTYDLPPTSREGYTFEGWYTTPNGADDPGQKVTSITVNPGSRPYTDAVYARWSANTYTLTYDKNNPHSASVDESDITLNPAATSVKAKYDSAWGTLATASKPGYVFEGWYTKPDGGKQVTSSTIVRGDITVYAHWRPITYTIRFNPNADNGEGEVKGEMPSIKVEYDQMVNLPANKYAKTVKVPAEDESGEVVKKSSVFKGWSYDAKSLTSSLADKASIMNLTRKDGDVIDFYAIWDDAPSFVVERYPDRYFTLKEAQDGKITEDELLKTVVVTDRETNPLPPKTTEQVESGDDVGVSIVGWNPDEFTDLTDDSTVSIRYKVKDESGNEAFLNIKVYVTRNSALAAEKESSIRSISSTYRNTLADNSRWKSDSLYTGKLDHALSGDNKMYTMTLHGDDLSTVRDYVEDNGFGNSIISDALSSLMNMFRRG